MSTEGGDGWVECRCGSRHWGRSGAAGLLLTDGARVVLQHRAGWSHFGDTWGIPGGALQHGESAIHGALREAHEEAGVTTADVRVVATSVLTHPDWSYTTVLGRAGTPTEVSATDRESHEVLWVPLPEVTERDLHPGFAEAWPVLRTMADADPHVVVDAANVVGSRPDGWWRDRRGATQRLLDQLDARAAQGVPAELLGLPGELWWPRWHAVVEGAARGVATTEHVAVTSAPGSGDDAIVALVAELASTAAPIHVVTADRGLADRVTALGATTLGPSTLLRTL